MRGRAVFKMLSVELTQPTSWTRLCSLAFVAVCLSGLMSPARGLAQVPPESTQAMTARVDLLLEQGLRDEGWQPAELCNDAAFLRRVMLDLTGAPPTAADVLSFLKDQSADKRSRLIDRLLSSPDCATHLAATWADWLLPAESFADERGGRDGLHIWLRERFADNLRYDRLIADLLVSAGPARTGPNIFFTALEGKPEKIAAKTARTFMGIQLDCAECHDHPFDDWSQKDFWGFAAYFAQLSVDEAMMGNGNVHDVAEGEVTLPGTEEIIAPRPLVQTGYSGIASGTRRQRLTLWLTAPENPFLARAAVNRVWSLLFGRGLIEPIDDMRDIQLASHPELLQELASYFARSGYDLRNLITVLAKTEAYQRATLHDSGNPPQNSYAVMSAKPLTQRQLVNSLTHVARQLATGESDAVAAGLARQLGRLRGDASEAQLGIVSALVALHGEAFDQASRENSSQLLLALTAPHMDSHKQVRWLFLATLGRNPTPAEQAAFSDFVSQPAISQSGTTEQAESPATAWQSDLLWALINSTEFAMTP